MFFLFNPTCNTGGCYVTAGRYLEVIGEITSELETQGLHPTTNRRIVIEDDPSTLFTIAGMQPLKGRFRNADGSQAATFQSCIRTNDIDEVGDGSHLTSFTMIGTFGFGSGNYAEHCSLWARIVRRLCLAVTHVTFHPETRHDLIWRDLGFHTGAR